ncbi:MAG: tRNA epoxyqueuosine(34) reductase QueG [Alphaproteobacteria bacterium]|nr:tRNA epoxyqueuosine(34) reductase QueG [Alphaproteobacteria bacterium]
MTADHPSTLAKIRDRIRADAAKEGFGEVAFAKADAPEIQADRLDAFIDHGYMGDMGWIAETRDRRISPRAMWPGARTAIVLGMNYGPDHDPMDNLGHRDAGNISVYARGKDYHEVIKGRLKQIAGRIAAREGVEVKVFVDTAPLMEKPLAARAGLGWQGKHTNLVSRNFGSWLFLGVILVAADWAEETPETDHCGSCTRCLDICPTNAFPAPYQLDARRCISYLTIEHQGMIPKEFRAAIGNRIFGCDDCLAVCPWNRFAAQAQEIKLKSLPGLDLPELLELAQLDEAEFRAKFAGSPVRRAGYQRFMRNVITAIGNTDNDIYISVLKDFLKSESELIKASAIGALARLMEAEAFDALRAAHQSTNDSPVIALEWQG